MTNLFENQTVIISGGLGDIGWATALTMAKEGASIALGDIHEESVAEKYLSILKQKGVVCHYRQVDVARAQSVRSWVDDVEKEIGPPTLIIANAGRVTLADMYSITPEQWEEELAVNLNGAFYLTQYATSRLLEHKLSGRVVFVGSWAGATVHQHIPAYSVSKAGLRMLCKCMALELAPHNILVNEVAPGYVDAGLSGKIWEDNPGMLKSSQEKVPIRKVMSAEAVAEQILYLCHPKNEHMTGATLLMDGGLSLLS